MAILKRCVCCDEFKPEYKTIGDNEPVCEDCCKDYPLLEELTLDDKPKWGAEDRRPTKWSGKAKQEHITCSLTHAYTIYLEPIPKDKIEALMDAYPNREWIGYLAGTIVNDKVCVEDITIPPHEEATGASAEAEPFHQPDNCVGIIHSHNSMGAFHSHTDIDYVDGNYPVSITVAKKAGELEYDAITVQDTACGKTVRLDCEVKYVAPKPEYGKEDWLKEAKGNIDKGIPSYNGSYYGKQWDFKNYRYYLGVSIPVEDFEVLKTCWNLYSCSSAKEVEALLATYKQITDDDAEFERVWGCGLF